MTENMWKRKLLAFLHDPPEKAYDYSREHGRRAQHYAERIGVNLSEWQDKLADYTAAAADRFIFPATKRKEGERWVDTGVPGLGEGVQFIHPLSGSKVDAVFPSEDEALGFCRDGFPDFAGITDPQLRFWLIWRLWRHYTVEEPQAKKFTLGLGCLPADTRIPDGTIWHHDAVVSALEAARDAQGHFAPAFLLFQIGPVQEFIAQARSTRDLWSGSYLLSWMMAHAMKLVADRFGPDAIIYPSLRGQPLYDWLEQTRLKQAFHTAPDGTRSQCFWEVAGNDKWYGQQLALTPTLPNRFLAVVPADFAPACLEDVFDAAKADSEWALIAKACWEFVSKVQLPEQAKTLWDAQLRRFWQVTWQLWPWQEVKPVLTLFKTIPIGVNSPLHLAREAALALPGGHKDTRCYADDLSEIKSKGWAWSAHYQLLQHRLDARRQTRDFAAWAANGPAHKDHFSGKEEVIATSAWLEAARKHDPLCHLFRHDDELGAVNIVKRVWHKAYLEKLSAFSPQLTKLTRARESFDSVPAVAAAAWVARLLERLRDESTWLDFTSLTQTLASAREALSEVSIPEPIAPGTRMEESRWLDCVDAEMFQQSFWDGLPQDTKSIPSVSTASRALVDFKTKHRLGEPSKYYAVLALDGDEIGKWLSGERTPKIRKVITGKAATYFSQTLREWRSSDGKTVEGWLDSSRPLSPSYHLQFSEALANFGLYCARRIIEAHHGQLIYCGGDDVLAMLPADEAITCAQGLRMAFQGSPALADAYPALFRPAPEGFIHLADKNDHNRGDWNLGCRRPAEPSWPLLVPGPEATVSVGLVIGHIKEPLQDMVQEAQQAEKRAKRKPEHDGWDRNALAVTLYKRSGETIQWGAKFGSKAFGLLALLQQHYRTPLDQPEAEMPISGKFPYRVTEMLAKFGGEETVTSDIGAMAQAEMSWVIGQQTRKGTSASTQEGLEKLRSQLRERCADYLEELRNSDRRLREFYHLFAIEAFIARQGE